MTEKKKKKEPKFSGTMTASFSNSLLDLFFRKNFNYRKKKKKTEIKLKDVMHQKKAKINGVKDNHLAAFKLFSQLVSSVSQLVD